MLGTFKRKHPPHASLFQQPRCPALFALFRIVRLELTDVPQPGYLGRHTPNVPAYVGIGLVAESEDPAEVVKRLKAEVAREDAERRGRREGYELAASVEDAVIATRRVRDDAARLAVEAAQE